MKSVLSAFAAVLMLSLSPLSAASVDTQPAIRVGIIGLDTSHVTAFTESLNRGPKNPADAPRLAGVRVVAAYPQGSRDIESSTRRVPEYTAAVRAMGVEIVDSIPALLARVDAVLLESNDGRVHLEQVLPVLRARKPVFAD
jgi:predicted dehydrogenase